MGKNMVYGLTDPRTGMVFYVGQSKNGLRRAASHRCPCHLAKDASPKGAWLRRLEADGVEAGLVVLEHVNDPDLLVEREQHWIDHYRVLNPDLTNVAPGVVGKRMRGRKLDDRHRRRLSEAAKKKWEQPGAREEMSAKMKGRVFSEETLQRMAEGQKRRVAREMQQARETGVRVRVRSHEPTGARSPEVCLNMAKAKGARAFIDQDGNIYESVRAAGRALGLDSSTISKVLHGKMSHTHGYVFTFI